MRRVFGDYKPCLMLMQWMNELFELWLTLIYPLQSITERNNTLLEKHCFSE